MKNTSSQSERLQTKPLHRPGGRNHPYVATDDLSALLRLALRLHQPGQRQAKLRRACSAMAKLVRADGWLAAVLEQRSGGRWRAIELLRGGVEWAGGDGEAHPPPAAPSALLPGRVLAALDGGDAAQPPRCVQSLQIADRVEKPALLTWVRVHRSASSPPFDERERRLMQLFHSQTAWVMLEKDAEG
jgi:hypothetical protein